MAKEKAKNTGIVPAAAAALRVKEPWEERLAAQAKQEKSDLTMGLPRITHKGGVLKIDDNKVADNKLVVIPLGFAFRKAYYEKEYEEGSSDTPDCYAAGAKQKGMVPMVESPDKQSDTCDGCPHNQFGTALKGNGKRCGDSISVLCLLASDLAVKGDEAVRKAVAKAVGYQISVPPTSLKGFGQFVSGLGSVTDNGNVREAVAEISTAPRGEGGYFVNFNFLDKVPHEAMPFIIERGEQAFNLLSQPFPKIEKQEKVQPKAVKGQKR